ncbi:MAG: N-acetyltransferase family protein [Planctomycetota bacterium]|nr:MAG: N-acetyltransferase family protein [Planctomycetota bacterium]
MTALIRDAVDADSSALCDIYNYYVLHSCHTFDVTPLNREDMTARIHDIQRDHGFLVLCSDDTPVGFASYGRFRNRAAYDHVVETSIYLDLHVHGKGWGSMLYQALLEHACLRQFHEAVAVIAAPNPASQRLHQRLGFCYCGTIQRSGRKFDRNIDTVYFQRSLKQDSPLA